MFFVNYKKEEKVSEPFVDGEKAWNRYCEVVKESDPTRTEEDFLIDEVNFDQYSFATNGIIEITEEN